MSDPQQRTLRTILTGVPGFLVLKNKKLKYEVVNPRFCQFLTLGPEEIIGKTDADLFPEDQAGLSAKEDQAVLESGMPRRLEQPLAGKEGLRWFDVTRTAILDDDGDPAGVLFTAYDITDFKKREVAVQQAEAQVNAAKQEAEAATAKLAAMEAELTAAVQAKETAAGNLAEAETRATSAEQAKAALESELGTLKTQVPELEQQLKAAQENEAALKQAAETAQAARAEAAALAKDLAAKLS